MEKFRRILKAKLHPDLKLDVNYLEIHGGDDETSPDTIVRNGQHQVHPDLIEAFNALRPHLATIAEQGSFTEFEDVPELLEKFPVTQLTLSGEEPHEGVTLTGMRNLANNKVLNMNTPFVKLNPDHSDYSYAESLQAAITNVLNEVDEYLNGKYAPSNQLGLFDAAEPGGDEGEEKVGKKKRTKKEAKVRKLNEEPQDMELAATAEM